MNIFAIAFLSVFSLSIYASHSKSLSEIQSQWDNPTWNDTPACRVRTPSPKRPNSPVNDPCRVPTPSPKNSPRKS